MGAPPLVSARGVSKSFDGAAVLAGLDLDVADGAHTLVTGPSGSGKSTLLHLLAALVRPDAGSLAFRGRDYETLGDPRAFRLRHVGLVFQDFHLLESLTARQEIEMVQLARGAPDPIAAGDLLGPLGLSDRLDVRVDVLSRGERQRIALARAFANRPDLVLADEPTASLDPSLRGRTLDHLFDLCRRTGATAIVVSHDLALAERPEIARAHRLEGGRLVPL